MVRVLGVGGIAGITEARDVQWLSFLGSRPHVCLLLEFVICRSHTVEYLPYSSEYEIPRSTDVT